MDTIHLFGHTLQFARLARANSLWLAVNEPRAVQVGSGHRVRLATAGPLSPAHWAHKTWTELIVHQWSRLLSLHCSFSNSSHSTPHLSVLYRLLILAFCSLGQQFPASPDVFSCYAELVYEHDDHICRLQQIAAADKNHDVKSSSAKSKAHQDDDEIGHGSTNLTVIGGNPQQFDRSMCQHDSCIISHRALFLRDSIQVLEPTSLATYGNPSLTSLSSSSSSSSPCVTPTLSFSCSSGYGTSPSSPFEEWREKNPLPLQLPPPIQTFSAVQQGQQQNYSAIKTYAGMLYLRRGPSTSLHQFGDKDDDGLMCQEDEDCDVEQLL